MNRSERKKQFLDPDIRYRGKPFWAWNGKLEKEELFRQIDVIKEMGFGGYFMHSRTGLETEYLGDEWFELTRECAEYGQRAGMESWLYDEDRWPSGSAGGLVTKEVKNRAMYISMTRMTAEEWKHYEKPSFEDPEDQSAAVDAGRPVDLAAAFACRIKDEILYGARTLEIGADLQEGEKAVIFELRYAACNDNYNGYCYLNTMNKEAVEAYLASTHEKYAQTCGDLFGKEILGIFTDEPHRGGCFTQFAEGEINEVPYTPGMFEEFEHRFGYSLKEDLPELFFPCEKEELLPIKHDFFEFCQQLFLECFAIPMSAWCREHRMLLTGHALQENSLCAQAAMQGSLMRFYEYMDYPGMDFLTAGTDCYWVAKQVVSVARQMGKPWVLSELYGCTGWQMDFQSYKNVGDWQAVQGINLRCPHLSWYTMKGEAKRDYPGSIFHQSAWYPEYRYVEDYFSRIHAAMDQGETVCDLLVLSPIESVWSRAYSGAFYALSAADEKLKQLEKRYQEIYHWLTEYQIAFDYGDEEILSRHGSVQDGVLYVGKTGYRKVLIAGMETARSSTWKLLFEFQSQGGSVIFAGNVPDYMDAKPSKEWERLAKKCIETAFEKESVAAACASGSEIRTDSEIRPYLMSFVKKVDEGRCVMILNADRERDYENVTLELGEGAFLEQWDPRTGKIFCPDYEIKKGYVTLTLDLERGGERIYMIYKEVPKQHGVLKKEPKLIKGESVKLPEHFRYSLSEENICVLDMVSVQDEKGFHIPQTEVLKADEKLREKYGLPYRSGHMKQPWYQKKFGEQILGSSGKATLTYEVLADVLPKEAVVAVESLENIESIQVNGTKIAMEPMGKWIDIAFDKLRIPDGLWKNGKNEIALTMDDWATAGIETIYLLGNFGVRLEGTKKILTTLPQTIRWGDLCDQGLPFYSGCVDYHIEGMEGKKLFVKISDFGGAMVKLKGRTEETLAFAPYEACVEDLYAMTVVLTRRNTFGPLHALPKNATYYHPGSFLTQKDMWCDSYVLYETGLLKEPQIQEC